MKKERATTETIIRKRSAFMGFSIEELIKRSGIKRTTFFRRLKYDDWSLDEIRILDRLLHFTDGDFQVMVRG